VQQLDGPAHITSTAAPNAERDTGSDIFCAIFAGAGAIKRTAMVDDAELIRRYVDDHAEDAFRELVKRHVNFVYSAALRQVNGDTHLAQDVVQLVFTGLARKAAALRDRQVLAGWLFVSTRYAAAKLIRSERRRSAREQEVHRMNEATEQSDVELEWERVRALLDDALSALGESDREAIFLRFFEGRGFAEVGARLALTENTARMRVERALEKLHQRLRKNGVSSSAAALALVLTNQAVVAAPAGLVASVSGAALASVAGGVTASAAMTFMSMSKLQLGILGAVAVVGATGLIVQDQKKAALVHELAAVRQDTSALQMVSPHVPPAAPRESAQAKQTSVIDAELAQLADQAAALQHTIAAQSRSGLMPATNTKTSGAVAKTDRARLDQAPVVVATKPPLYPKKLQDLGIEGSVVVEFVVDSTGVVQNAVAVESSNPGFEAAAVAAVAGSKFQAGRKGGRAINTRLKQVIKFVFSENATATSNWF
jgi:RNA polymerase sigma factor (sigma-70 family)